MSDGFFLSFDETDLLPRFDHEVTPELWSKITACGEEQRRYQSAHKYNLAKFGLTEAQIQQDCAFYYETFLPPLDKADPDQADWDLS